MTIRNSALALSLSSPCQALVSCSVEDGANDTIAGGSGMGGTTSMGGAAGGGGTTSMGGTMIVGGTTSMGGAAGGGGTTSMGGAAGGGGSPVGEVPVGPLEQGEREVELGLGDALAFNFEPVHAEYFGYAQPTGAGINLECYK